MANKALPKIKTKPIKLSPEMCGRVQLLSVEEAAEFLGIPSRAVYGRIQQNKLAYIRIDSLWRIAVWKDDYEKFLEKKGKPLLKTEDYQEE